MSKLIIEPSPHIKSGVTTQKIMLSVIIALLPALVASVWIFGLRALIMTVICCTSCVIFEWACRKIMKRNNTISDLSAVVTGMLLAFNLPVTLPFYRGIIGCFVAIVIVKQFFGGIGQNFINPALASRAILALSWASLMNTFAKPAFGNFAGVDAIASATPIGATVAGDYTLTQLFLGNIPGTLGETCKLALLLGGVYLVIRKVISWHTPVAYIGTVAILTLIAAPAGISGVDYMLYNVFGGGLMLGAIFMATDYATSPVTKPGQLIFGIGCGLLTCFIRRFGSYPEGVCYSILIMNCTTWLLDKYIRPTIYGAVKKEKKEKKEATK